MTISPETSNLTVVDINKNQGQTVEDRSYVDMVLDELLMEFDQGLIKPGKRIKAAQISARLGISRGPVREALAILSGRGLIELNKNLGAILKPMTVDGVIKNWQIFDPLLGYAILEAVKNLTAEDKVIIERAMERIRERSPIDRGYVFYLPLTDYHELVNGISGNEFVQETMEKMNVMYWIRFLSDFIDLDNTWPQYVKNYQRITDGILEGDGPAANAAWSFHVSWSIDQIRRSGGARLEHEQVTLRPVSTATN